MKNQCLKALLLGSALLLSAWQVRAQVNPDIERQKAILAALNSVSNEWIAPIQMDDIHIKNGQGRVDVNKDVKFSYYIQTENPADPNSQITLIPMATSRYTPTYYQTDDWWDAHKAEIDAAKAAGRPAPRQDMAEVEVWLNKMKLSTNPIVMQIKPGQAPQITRLQDFLLDVYVKTYARDGKITLFRGGEKPTETADWLAGRRPRGVRYWTPTATYAWRYARKNAGFLDDLIAGRPPLYVFEIPVAQFKTMIQQKWQQLTLGTELTKKVHDNFDRTGQFMDQLMGNSDYMGVGNFGVEFEIRASTQGSNNMQQFFKRTITVEEFVTDRLDLFDRTAARLIKARPQDKETLQKQFASRQAQVLLEGKILLALQLKLSRETVASLLQQYGNPQYSELANTDSVRFPQYVQSKMASLPSQPLAVSNELKMLDQKIVPHGAVCDGVF